MEVNKYKKNENIKADTPLKTMASFGGIGLMLLGLVGLAFELFKEDSWVKNGLAKLFSSSTSMMFIPVIIFALWFLNRMMSSTGKDTTNKAGDLPMYLMMGLGAYYLYRLATTGGF